MTTEQVGEAAEQQFSADRLEIKQPNGISATEPDRERARPQIILKFNKNTNHASFFLLYLSRFFSYLHLMGTALEILQHRNITA